MQEDSGPVFFESASSGVGLHCGLCFEDMNVSQNRCDSGFLRDM